MVFGDSKNVREGPQFRANGKAGFDAAFPGARENCGHFPRKVRKIEMTVTVYEHGIFEIKAFRAAPHVRSLQRPRELSGAARDATPRSARSFFPVAPATPPSVRD